MSHIFYDAVPTNQTLIYWPGMGLDNGISVKEFQYLLLKQNLQQIQRNLCTPASQPSLRDDF